MCEVKPIPDGFTAWDKIVVNRGDLTVEEFIETFPKIHHGCNVTFLCKYGITQEDIDKGVSPMYLKFPATKSQKELTEENKKRKVREAYEHLYDPIDANRKYVLLDAQVEDPEGNPAKIPFVKYVWG